MAVILKNLSGDNSDPWKIVPRQVVLACIIA